VGRARRAAELHPYLGPIAAALLLAVGGLMTFSDPWYALLPARSSSACIWSRPM
jgi:hypothetical protein